MKKQKRLKTKIKLCTAWALIDPDDLRIQPHMIFDEPVRNAGRGSITEGWKCIRVEVRAMPRRNKSKR